MPENDANIVKLAIIRERSSRRLLRCCVRPADVAWWGWSGDPAEKMTAEAERKIMDFAKKQIYAQQAEMEGFIKGLMGRTDPAGIRKRQTICWRLA